MKEVIISDIKLDFSRLNVLDHYLRQSVLSSYVGGMYHCKKIIYKEDCFHFLYVSKRVFLKGYIKESNRQGFTYNYKTKKIEVWSRTSINTIVSLSDLKYLGLDVSKIPDLNIRFNLTKTVIEKIINKKIKTYKKLVEESYKVSYKLKLDYKDILFLHQQFNMGVLLRLISSISNKQFFVETLVKKDSGTLIYDLQYYPYFGNKIEFINYEQLKDEILKRNNLISKYNAITLTDPLPF